MSKTTRQTFLCALLLATILTCLFAKSIFNHDYVVFSNDGPLGAISSTQASFPQAITGLWADLNYLGSQNPALMNFSAGFRILTEHYGFSIVGITAIMVCAWQIGHWRVATIICVIQVVLGLHLLLGLQFGWIAEDSDWWYVFPLFMLMFPFQMAYVMEVSDPYYWEYPTRKNK